MFVKKIKIHHHHTKHLGGDIAGTGIGGRPRDAAKGIGETVDTELVDATRSAERKPLVDGNDEVGKATCGRGIRR